MSNTNKSSSTDWGDVLVALIIAIVAIAFFGFVSYSEVEKQDAQGWREDYTEAQMGRQVLESRMYDLCVENANLKNEDATQREHYNNVTYCMVIHASILPEDVEKRFGLEFPEE